MPKRSEGGFALLISVIFMSVMLTFGLALSSLGYKQTVLASSSLGSRSAFYAADTALECALYVDQQLGSYAYPPIDPGIAPIIDCSGVPAVSSNETWSATKWIVSSRVSLDSGTHCADVTMYKYSTPQPPNNITTYIFSQGYDVACATVAGSNGARFASRGLSIHY